jgi:hypothetical protein
MIVHLVQPSAVSYQPEEALSYQPEEAFSCQLSAVSQNETVRYHAKLTAES